MDKLFGGGLKPAAMLLNVIKLTVLVLVAYSAIRDRVDKIVLAQGLGFTHLAIFHFAARRRFTRSRFALGIALLIIAIIEYIYQKWRIEQDLKMTKQEVKEEMRRMEGDPKIKARRRQLAFQRLKKQLQKDVPTADVVVTNPTEFAIALKYDSTAMHAPKGNCERPGLHRPAHPRNRRSAWRSDSRKKAAGPRAIQTGQCRPGNSRTVLRRRRGDSGVRLRVEWKGEESRVEANLVFALRVRVSIVLAQRNLKCRGEPCVRPSGAGDQVN